MVRQVSPRAEFFIAAHPELSRRTRLRGVFSCGSIHFEKPLENLRASRKMSTIVRQSSPSSEYFLMNYPAASSGEYDPKRFKK